MSSWKKFEREWVRPLLLALILVTTFRSAVADWNDVPTGSMKPTILEGDRIFVNKLAYSLRVPFTLMRLASWDQPSRGDVVVLLSPADGKRLVKRVVGLPGDQIEMRDNRVWVNGVEAAYDSLDRSQMGEMGVLPDPQAQIVLETIGHQGHPVRWRGNEASGGATFGPLKVPDASYFVLGDNRDESADSRFFGFVPGERILGEATTVVLSLDPEHHRMPRWQRFFQALP